MIVTGVVTNGETDGSVSTQTIPVTGLSIWNEVIVSQQALAHAPR